MVNAGWRDIAFVVQEGQASEWYRVIDTSLPSPEEFFEQGMEEQLRDRQYGVKARSVVVLIRQENSR